MFYQIIPLQHPSLVVFAIEKEIFLFFLNASKLLKHTVYSSTVFLCSTKQNLCEVIQQKSITQLFIVQV